MFTCVDCHTDVKSAAHATTPKKITCAVCHGDEQAAYDRSDHGKAVQNGNAHAANCVDCHGSPHELLLASDPKSRVHHANIPATCGSCHSQEFVMENSGLSPQMVASYQQSVHGHAVAAGSEKAAVCTDCHGTHEILDAKNSKSPIFKFNVAFTCGKCHDSIAKEYQQSIHGTALAQGNWQAPVCTDCHGIHSIKARNDANSPVSTQNVAQATCASCHGTHSIFPSSDPRSTIHRANLARTCGQCHPGATDKFTSAKVHVDAPLSADVGSKAVRWIRRFYLGMIFAVIGGMLLHNFIIWRSKVVDRRKLQGPRFVTRMPLRFRWQHATLLTSFLVLVVSGFALKFPGSWFASMLAMGERMRGTLHRIAAVVLIGVSIYHLFDAAIGREGRRLARDLFPTLDDARGAWQNLCYYLGLTSRKPEFARFNYAEKVEYWALVWGMLVMATTGIMLWAKVMVGNHLPRWWLDVATAIHFYEAVLATLAILVWHFYQVFFDPDVYPMNWAWWDGKMTLDHYQQEHGLDGNPLIEIPTPTGTQGDSVEQESEPTEVKHGD
jgi:cytochrome b subunit of formate dehydrogenase